MRWYEQNVFFTSVFYTTLTTELPTPRYKLCLYVGILVFMLGYVLLLAYVCMFVSYACGGESPRAPGPQGPWAPGSQGPWPQGLKVPGPRVPGPLGPGPWAPMLTLRRHLYTSRLYNTTQLILENPNEMTHPFIARLSCCLP